MYNVEDYDAESVNDSSLQDSVDIDYLKEMYQYELNAKRDSDSVEMSLEEENEIVGKIKEEILLHVRDEMESELGKYNVSTTRTDSTAESLQMQPYEEMDPIIRKGLYQIKKLDKILLRKMKIEKEVKRERILLQKRLREELNEIEREGKKPLPKEIKSNVMKFLALKPPPRHNEGLNENTAEDEVPRLFQTEVGHDDFTCPIKNGKDSKRSSPSTSSKDSKLNMSDTSKAPSSNKKPHSKAESQSTGTTETKVKEKNFILRNIELASKASESVPLTDAERMRLDYLLSDIDKENFDGCHENINNLGLVTTIEENPFQIVTMDQYPNHSADLLTIGSRCDSGHDDDSDITSVRHQLSVESRLKMYMGNENYMQLSKVDEKSLFPEGVKHLVLLDNEANIDIEALGEKTLKEVKYNRESQKRIQEIDENLRRFKDLEFFNQLEEEALLILNNTFRDTISQSNCSMVSENVSEKSSDEFGSESLSEFKFETKLSQDVLEKLLNEARISEMNFKNANTLSKIYEQDEINFDTSIQELESTQESESVQVKEDFSSRFPDINIYKRLTSPSAKF